MSQIRLSEKDKSKIKNPFDKNTNFVPLAKEYSNFEIAKKLFTENLEHHPLPDKVCNDAYQKLQMQKEKNAGIALEENYEAPVITGVAYSESGAKGPTQCTKYKVYRPKSCTEKKKSFSIEMPRYIIRKNYVTPIELALGWDVVPVDPKDEPKPPTHIDGSNGSRAPSVFMLVHSPLPDSYKEDYGCYETEQHEVIEQGNPSSEPSRPNAGALFSVNPDMKKNFTDPNFEQRRPIECECYKHQAPQSTRKKISSFFRPCKIFKQNKHGFSPKNKSEYKAAFKPLNPRSLMAECYQGNVQRPVKVVRVPKQPDPYTRRSYQIDTLAPPFSLLPSKRMLEYPERNRLLTTYQQSYNRYQRRYK